jgi:hypothetical protein
MDDGWRGGAGLSGHVETERECNFEATIFFEFFPFFFPLVKIAAVS